MPRNRQQTEARIRAAALHLLRQSGFENWGVNSIARQAGADKVLIYRYFGSLDGLLEQLIAATPFWPDPAALPDTSPENFLAATQEALQAETQAFTLLAHPSGRSPISSIRRKFDADLKAWLAGFRQLTRGFVSEDQLSRLPALLHFQAATGRESLSAHDLWNQVSPPLEWGQRLPDQADGELPTELL